MKSIFSIFALAAVMALATGCVAERSHYVPQGAGKTTSGFSQNDIDATVGQAMQKLNQFSVRYAAPNGARRIVNVKNVVNDCISRGLNAETVAEEMSFALKEQLTNAGLFIIYNERIAAAGTINPEFLLESRLQQRNMRRDDGNVYQEFSLNMTMIDVTPGSPSYGLEIWQARIPLKKGVDRRNIYAN